MSVPSQATIDITAPAIYPLPEGYTSADEYENVLLTIALLEQAESEATEAELHQPFQGVKTMFDDLDGYVSKIGKKMRKVSRVVSLKSNNDSSIRTTSTRASATVTISVFKKRWGFGTKSKDQDPDATPTPTKNRGKIFVDTLNKLTRTSPKLSRRSSTRARRLSRSFVPCTSTTESESSHTVKKASGLPWGVSVTETTAAVQSVMVLATSRASSVEEATTTPPPPPSPRRDSNDSDVIMERLMATQVLERDARRKMSILAMFGSPGAVECYGEEEGPRCVEAEYEEEQGSCYEEGQEEQASHYMDDEEELSGLNLDGLEDFVHEEDEDEDMYYDDEENYTDADYINTESNNTVYPHPHGRHHSPSPSPPLSPRTQGASSLLPGASVLLPRASPLLPRADASKPRRLLRIRSRKMMREQPGTLRVKTKRDSAVGVVCHEDITTVHREDSAVYREDTATTATLYVTTAPAATQGRHIKKRKALDAARKTTGMGKRASSRKGGDGPGAKGDYVFKGSLRRLVGGEVYVVVEGKRKRA